MLDLLAIGGITIDHIFTVDRFPAPHFEAVIDQMSTHYGGRAANVAAMVGKLGLKSAIVSPVGSDFVSSGYKTHLESLNVDLSGVKEIPNHLTKQIYIYTSPDGDQITFFHYGAETFFKTYPIPEEIIEMSRLVHISSSGDYVFNMECARIAHKLAKPVSFDVGNDPFTEIPKYLKGMASHSSLFFMNNIELSSVLKGLSLKEVDDLLQFGPKVVIVINKKDKSAEIVTEKNVEKIPSLVRFIKDPTGGSDGFVAGFLSGYLHELGLRVAGLLGAAEASFIVETTGSQSNLPDWRQIRERVNAYKELD